MTDPATRLAEAETALHDLQRGVGIVRIVDQNGEQISYRPGQVAMLSAYVGTLKRQVAGKKPVRGFNPTLTRGF